MTGIRMPADGRGLRLVQDLDEAQAVLPADVSGGGRYGPTHSYRRRAVFLSRASVPVAMRCSSATPMVLFSVVPPWTLFEWAREWVPRWTWPRRPGTWGPGSG
ncbi:hypothetical protein DQ384_30780 [Sphaerisporangium album]|uniref:Uncharacterized protein n=1 Tax=Sphaerisporangium album TaxID=509200 RepID=A0A367F6B0_9ACTN|nr:hypothetical protein DQ384_30780 [Sphaerisporangium album]